MHSGNDERWPSMIHDTDDQLVIATTTVEEHTDAQVRSVAQGFEPLARAAVTIPYDPALRKGQIRYGSLRPATQRAWLAAAAAVEEGLSEAGTAS